MLTALEAGVHVVIGSSGLTAEDFVEIDRLARARRRGRGGRGQLLDTWRRSCCGGRPSLAAEHLQPWEIIDYAGADKPDVPSGTARELAETLAQVRRPAHGWRRRRARPGRGPCADVAGTRVHSVRLPTSW